MEFDTNLLTAVGELLQGGVMIGFLVLFVTGKIYPAKAVDELREEGRNHTKLVASEISKGIKGAVKEAIIEANAQIKRNNK